MKLKSPFAGATRNRFSLMFMTLLAVTGAACLYYFFYLNSREENLDAHYYRAVQRVRGNIETSMSGLYSMADGNADAAFRRIASLMRPKDKGTENYMMRLEEAKARLALLKSKPFKPTVTQTGKPKPVHPAEKEIKELEQRIIGYKLLIENDSLEARQHELDSIAAINSVKYDVKAPWNKGRSWLRLHEIKTPSKDDSLFKLAENNHSREYRQLSRQESVFRFVKYKTQTIGRRDISMQIEFRSSLDTVLMSALDENELDGFIITFNDETIFETIPTGLDSIQFDSLFTVKEAGGSKAASQLRCAGTEYRCFVQPFRLNKEGGWKLIGLKSAQVFSQEKHLLPRSLRFGVFIALLLAILALPFIKSLIMSRTERLQVADVIFAVFSLVVTVSLVTLLLFDGFLSWGIDRQENNYRQEMLAEKIDKNLLSEIDTIYKELSNYEQVVTSTAVQKDTLKNYQARFYPNYSFLFTVDSTGNSGNDARDPNYIFNVSKRLYFQNILRNRCSYLEDTSKRFVLESIMSWREGRLRAAVSKPCRAPYVAVVLTCDLKSLTRPVLPANSGFCLMDHSGNVLFHSNPAKSLNENFIAECNNNSLLLAAISGRKKVHFSGNYSAGAIDGFIRPLERSPYFIVTYEISSENDALHGQVFGSAMILQTIVILVYLLLFMVIHFMSRHESRLRVPQLNFEFFLPGFHKKEVYLKASLFCLVQLVLMLATEIWLRKPMLTIFVFFTSPVFIIYFVYLFTGRKIPKAKTWPGIPRLLIFSGLVGIQLTAFRLLDHYDYAYFAAYQLLTFFAYRLARRLSGGVMQWVRNNKAAYRMLAFLLVCIVCVVPVTSFAVMAYDTENEIAAKTQQLDMMYAYARRMEPREGQLYRVSRPSASDPGNYSSAWFGSTITTKASPETQWQASKPYQVISTLLRASARQGGYYSRLLGAGASDKAWRWGRSSRDSLVLQVFSPSLLRNNASHAFVLHSNVPVFRLIDPQKNSWVSLVKNLLCLFTLLVILYYILHLFIRKLFAHEVFRKTFNSLDLRFFSEDRPEFRIFVTGLPCSGKTNYFNQLFKDRKNVTIIDLIGCGADGWAKEQESSIGADEGTLILDHFEFDCLNKDTNLVKLELLEQLSAMKNKRIIIVSAIHPEVFLEQYGTARSKKESSGNETETGDRWSKALTGFYNLWFPIQGIGNGENRDLEEQINQLQFPEEVRQTIREECSQGHFLRTIGQELCRNYEGKDLAGDDPLIVRLTQENIILKVQQLAHVYYLSIWSQLTKEEQYVLFDLAQDNLVNTKNMDVVDTLAKKGLVVYDKSLKLMNRSFQNFILTVIESRDLLKLEQADRETGNWHRYKRPLMLVVIALLVFIFRTDENETFTWITSFAAGVPLVISLLSSFGRGGGKTQE